MAETPQPTPQVEAPLPKPEASKGDTGGAPEKSGSVAVASRIESQIQSAEAAGAMNGQAEKQAFEDLANRGNELSTDARDDELHAMIDQQTGGIPAAERPQSDFDVKSDDIVTQEVSAGNTPAAEQTTPPGEVHNDIDAQQSQLDTINAKSTDELQQIAQTGGELGALAKQRLESMGIQTENQAAATGTPAAETATPATEQTTQTQNPDAPIPGDNTVGEVLQGDANYTEPSADQRTNGANVEATNANVPPPIENQHADVQNSTSTETATPTVQPEVPGQTPPLAEETGESVVAGAEQITKDAAETSQPEVENGRELTIEEKIVQERKLAAEGVQSLAKLGIDINSEAGQKVIDLMTENPQYAEAFKAAAEAAGANKNISGPEGAAAAANAQAEALQDQADKADKAGDTERSKRMKFLIALLQALAVAIAVPVVAAVGAGAAVGAIVKK